MSVLPLLPLPLLLPLLRNRMVSTFKLVFGKVQATAFVLVLAAS